MANYPTPENIVSITYQLKQQVNDPASIRGQLPCLTIQFVDDNSVTRNKVVTFREMLPYLKYLHDKAISLGKVIVCDPEATFDYKIVFIVGEPTAGQLQIVQVAATGENICAAIPIVIYLDHAAPFVVGDIIYTDAAATIPLTGYDLITNVETGEIFGLDNATGEVLAATGAVCTTPPPVITPFQVTFQNNGVDFNFADNTLIGTLNCTSDLVKTISATGSPFVCVFKLPIRDYGNLENDYQRPANCRWDVLSQTGTNYNVSLVYLDTVGGNINILHQTAINQNRVKISITDPGWLYQGIAVGGTSDNLASTGGMAVCEQGYQSVATRQYTMNKLTQNPDASNYYFGYLINAALYPTIVNIGVTFKLLGAIVSSIVVPLTDFTNTGFVIPFADIPNVSDHDEIVFELLEATSGLLGINNQMGAVPGETTTIIGVNNSDGPISVVPAYPVNPLSSATGSFTGHAADNVDVILAGTTIVSPSIVRLIDAVGTPHDLPYTSDVTYSFLAVNTLGTITVVLL